jgi:hypothetical protein
VAAAAYRQAGRRAGWHSLHADRQACSLQLLSSTLASLSAK